MPRSLALVAACWVALVPAASAAPASLQALRAGAWVGPILADTGEVVTVYVSRAYPRDPEIPQRAADFLAGLFHGAELATVVVLVATPDEIERACSRQPSRTAFPGDSGRHYGLDPGKVFAETYRLLNFRERSQAGWTPAPRVDDQSLFPDARALDAVRDDVMSPWQGSRPEIWSDELDLPYRRAGGKTSQLRATRVMPTPLDGVLNVKLLDGPEDATLSLLDRSGRTVACRAATERSGTRSAVSGRSSSPSRARCTNASTYRSQLRSFPVASQTGGW